MIGSRQGWVEAPYVACPGDRSTRSARGLVARPAASSRSSPASRRATPPASPTSCAARRRSSSARSPPTTRACSPCCPARTANGRIVERGRVVDFATFMTGELYAVLLDAQHPRPPGRRERRGVAARAAFARGVARGLGAGGLAHDIFGARTLALAGELAPGDVADWLSGVLIGREIRDARALGASDARRATRRACGSSAATRSPTRYAARLRWRGIDAERGAARCRGARPLAHRRARPDFVHRRHHDRSPIYLDPLPLIAVLRGITPEEIPAVGAALADARLPHSRGAAQFAAAVRVSIRAARARSSASAASSARAPCIDVADVARVREAGGRLIVMPHADVAVIREAKRQRHGLRSRRRDADRGVRRARRRRRRAQDVSRRGAAAGGAEGVARRAAARTRWCSRSAASGPTTWRRTGRPARTASAPARICTSRARSVEHGARRGRRVRARLSARCRSAERMTRRAALRHRRARRAAGRVQPDARRRSATPTCRASAATRRTWRSPRRGSARAPATSRASATTRSAACSSRCGSARASTPAAWRSTPTRRTGVYFVTHGPAGHEFTLSARRLGGEPRWRPSTLPLDVIRAAQRAARVGHQPGDLSASACDAVFAAIDDGARAPARASPTIRNLRLEAVAAAARARGDRGDDGACATGSCRAWTTRGRCSATSEPDAIDRLRAIAPGAPVVVLKLRRAKACIVSDGRRARAHRRHARRDASMRPAPATASTARSPRGSSPATTPFAAARYANAAAALATTGYGAVAPLPRDADVRALLATRRPMTARRPSATTSSRARSRWSSGGTSGIGAAIADALAALRRRRHRDRRDARPKPTRRARRPAFRCRDARRARRARRRRRSRRSSRDLPRLDILVNCAGHHPPRRRARSRRVRRRRRRQPDRHDALLRRARDRCSRKARGASSTPRRCSRSSAAALVPGYSASKGGVAQLTKSLAIAYAAGRHSRQRHRAGLGRNGAHAGAAGRSGAQRGDPRAHAARTLGRAGRHRGRRRVPVLAGRALRHRRHPAGRRRLSRRMRARRGARMEIRWPLGNGGSASRSKGDWQKAHAIVQNDASSLGCWAHGIVHMLEGDLGNARYWYRRAHRAFPTRQRRQRGDRRAGGARSRNAHAMNAPADACARAGHPARDRGRGDSRRRARLGAAGAGRLVPAAAAQHRQRRLVQSAARAAARRAVAASPSDGSSSAT